MFEAHFLDDSETSTYLHSAISEEKHQIKVPETPMYLDALLADTPLIGGFSSKLGNQHLKTITILGFPATTMPALLDQLNQLPICYRWMTRFIALDKVDAESALKGYKRKWFAKRKGLMHLLQEIFTKSESQLVDTAAMDKANDADQALKELAEDYVSYGYYTATITLADADSQQLTSMQREVERVVNGLGFATIVESFNAVEAWLFLDHPLFADKIRDWLKTLRKKNVSVIFATQSVEDALSTNIAPALLESCPSRILLPNDRALEAKIRESYEKLGLNERQLQILSTSTPKLQYYFQSSLGNRLFNLDLGPIALAFCAMSRPEDRVLIKEIAKNVAGADFLEHYLDNLNLGWAWDLVSEVSS